MAAGTRWHRCRCTSAKKVATHFLAFSISDKPAHRRACSLWPWAARQRYRRGAGGKGVGDGALGVIRPAGTKVVALAEVVVGLNDQADQSRTKSKLSVASRRCMKSRVHPIEIRVHHGVDDISNDNADADVVLSNGESRTVTFFTLKSIEEVMKRYKESGECLSGKFFWAKDLVIVESLDSEVIRKVVWELVESGEYEAALGRK